MTVQFTPAEPEAPPVKEEAPVAANDEGASKTSGGVETNATRFPPPTAELGEQLRDRAANHTGQSRVAHLVAAASMEDSPRVGPFLHVAGLGWHCWDGKRFAEDEEDKLVTDAVLRVIRDNAYDALSDQELRSALRASSSASGVSGVLKLMSALPGVRASVEDLDRDPYLLNTENGTLDLRELSPQEGAVGPVDLSELVLRPHNPADRITRVTRAAFDPDADSEVWGAFLDKSLPNVLVREYLQRSFGVGLIGEQVAHILDVLTGDGRNGKGVAYETMHNLMGDYSHIAPSSLLELVKNADPNRPQPAFIELRGKRFVWLSETEKTVNIGSALLKRMTGGDPITGRGLHSGVWVTFDPSHSMYLITNDPPRLPADDKAVWERVKLGPFNVVVPPDERDPHLKRKLRGGAHMSAILSWMLRGLAEYFVTGLNEPHEVSSATAAYRGEQDTVGSFLRDMCDEDPGGTDGSGSKALHDAYLNWFRGQGIPTEHRLNAKDFGARLDDLGFKTKRKSSGMVRMGLWLTNDPMYKSTAVLLAHGITVSEPMRLSETDPQPEPSEEKVARLKEELAELQARPDAGEQESMRPPWPVSGR